MKLTCTVDVQNGRQWRIQRVYEGGSPGEAVKWARRIAKAIACANGAATVILKHNNEVEETIHVEDGEANQTYKRGVSPREEME